MVFMSPKTNEDHDVSLFIENGDMCR